MPVQTKSKTIDGHKVDVTQFAALIALSLKSKILRFAGDSIVKALMLEGDLFKGEMPYDRIEAALANLCNKLEPVEYQNLILEILRCTRVDGKELTADGFTVFDGQLVLMYKVIWFTLEANYGDFFALAGSGLMSQIGGMNQKTGMPARSRKSPTASTKTSQNG